MSSAAGGTPSISQMRAREGPSHAMVPAFPPGGGNCRQLSAQQRGKEAVLILLQPTVTHRNGRGCFVPSLSWSDPSPDSTGVGWGCGGHGLSRGPVLLPLQQPSLHLLSEFAEHIIGSHFSSCTTSSAWNNCVQDGLSAALSTRPSPRQWISYGLLCCG